MKIGMLSTSKQLNYGGVLQAFALLKVTESATNNAKIETININITKNSAELFGEPYLELVKVGSRATLKRILIRALFPFKMSKHRLRRKRTIQFINQRLYQGRTLYAEPEDFWKNCPYNLIIVGSDQVWRYNSRIHKFCLLSGLISRATKRIAYAVSLGWHTLPGEHEHTYKSSIERFDAISVRESSSIQKISELINDAKPIFFCLDPVLLLSRRHWYQLLNDLPDKTASEGEPYAFVYWLTHLEGLEEIFAGLQQNGFKKIIVSCSWYNSTVGGKLRQVRRYMSQAESNYNVEWAIDAGPQEFLHLLANSSFVVAGSFHAMMFSLIFSKPMRIFTHIHGHEDPMAPRMTDFARQFGINDVVHQGIKDNCNFTPATPLNFENIWKQIDLERLSSMTFLINSMKDCGVEIDKSIDELL